MTKFIIPYMNVVNETSALLIQKAEEYENNGADYCVIADLSEDLSVQEEFLMKVKEVVKAIDLPIIISTTVRRFEDVKKALYTGAKAVLVRYDRCLNEKAIAEAVKRFGTEQIIVDVTVLFGKEGIEQLVADGVTRFACYADQAENIAQVECEGLRLMIYTDNEAGISNQNTLAKDFVEAAVCADLQADTICNCKQNLKSAGIDVKTLESSMEFSEFKLNSDGLLPVVIQDYKTKEVLMMAYMNEESYNLTVKTGRMTYYSRSRKKLWVKGEESGHFQYVKELKIDCDKDTLLAKVKQVGAACHTGNRSCFYTDLVKKQYDHIDPLTVFEDVYNIILDRKNNPKEGSYTNYLFDKGIDKILKKCGEEATEIVIAAKNPEVEELKYEISDFMYHVMVLMVERGVDWDDITRELAHRR